MTGKELQEQLAWKIPHIASKAPEQIEAADGFCDGYKQFLDQGKTERECVKAAEKLLIAAGYTVFDEKKSYKPGDKVYRINRGKSILATTFGTKPIEEGVRISGAHIDAPRLDLKANPFMRKKVWLCLRRIITAVSASISGLRFRWPCTA